MTKKNKLDCVSEFAKKWLVYQKAASDWILAIDRLGLSSVDSYEWLTNDEVFRKFEGTLKKHNVKKPDIGKFYHEANEVAIPILEFLFGPNETPVIPEFPSWFPGGFNEWSEKTRDMDLNMMHRIMGARNKILASEFKTKPKLIPRLATVYRAMMKKNHIYLGDCVEIMEREIDKDSINLIYADPPYNLSGKVLNLINNKTGGAFYKMNEDWDTWNYDEYVKFTERWIKKCRNNLKPNGSLYISCTHHNLAEIVVEAKKIGFKLNNIITWYKTNAMPSITKRTFTHSTEFVCWFVKGKGWKYNYFQLKEWNPQKTQEGESKQLRDFIHFIELPIVQGRERVKGLSGRALHPTQKPEKLIELIIMASSDKNDLILDPFFGTGTTGIVASRLGRKWIGIESNKKYFDVANKRIFRKN